MAKILCPNREYNGVVGGVAFAAGKGETNDPVLIEWFARHGYTVTGEGAPEGKLTTLAEDPRALERSVVELGRPPEDGAFSKGLTDDQRRETYGAEVGQMVDHNTPTGAPQLVPPPPPPDESTVTHPGPAEQVGLTADQADELARTKAALSGAVPAAPAKSTRRRTRKSTSRKSTGRKKAGGTK